LSKGPAIPAPVAESPVVISGNCAEPRLPGDGGGPPIAGNPASISSTNGHQVTNLLNSSNYKEFEQRLTQSKLKNDSLPSPPQSRSLLTVEIQR